MNFLFSGDLRIYVSSAILRTLQMKINDAGIWTSDYSFKNQVLNSYFSTFSLFVSCVIVTFSKLISPRVFFCTWNCWRISTPISDILRSCKCILIHGHATKWLSLVLSQAMAAGRPWLMLNYQHPQCKAYSHNFSNWPWNQFPVIPKS